MAEGKKKQTQKTTKSLQTKATKMIFLPFQKILFQDQDQTSKKNTEDNK